MARNTTHFICRIVLVCTTIASIGLRLAAQEREYEATLSANFEYDIRTRELVATVNAQMTFEDWLLSADEIRVNQEDQIIKAKGNVVFTRGDIRFIAKYLELEMETRRTRIEDFRAGNGRYFVSGTLLVGNPENFRFEEIKFHPGEPGTYLFKAQANEIAIIDQDHIEGEKLSFTLGLVPFFIIPSISQPIDAEHHLLKMDLDYSGHIGAAVGTELRVPINSNFRLGANLMLTSKRGILAGPAFEYHFDNNENSSRGAFTSGYIDDSASEIRPDLITGNPIDDERFFAEWQHQQNWGENGAITAYGRWWSDPEVTRDFYEDSFESMQDPDSFIEANYSGENWQATLFTRLSPNEFQSFTERLPELRFDFFPTTLAKGLTSSGSLSFAKLRNDQIDPIYFDHETDRADAYYGIRYNRPFESGFTLTTKAGLKAIHYFDNLIASNPETDLQPSFFDVGLFSIFDDYRYFYPRPSIDKGTRAFGDIGFDLKLTAHRTSNYQNKVWNIDGLRHIVEPVLSYRYTPLIDGDNVNAVQDVPAFSSYLTPIDIEDRRDIDTLGEHHITRLEIRNRIQTRDKNFGSRNLARFNFAIDYLIDGYGQEGDLSDFHSDIEITPAPWLEIDLFSRYDIENNETRELNTSWAITDPGYWKFGVGNHFLRSALNQYFLFGEYNLNENFKVYVLTKFDETSDTFYEQRIGFMQRALEKYGIKYELRIFEGSRRESDFGIRIGIDLFDE